MINFDNYSRKVCQLKNNRCKEIGGSDICVEIDKSTFKKIIHMI